jgi:hypothetical protein
MSKQVAARIQQTSEYESPNQERRFRVIMLLEAVLHQLQTVCLRSLYLSAKARSEFALGKMISGRRPLQDVPSGTSCSLFGVARATFKPGMDRKAPLPHQQGRSCFDLV